MLNFIQFLMTNMGKWATIFSEILFQLTKMGVLKLTISISNNFMAESVFLSNVFNISVVENAIY